LTETGEIKPKGSKVRIIIINDFAYVNGGASQVALADAVGLQRAGHRVTFFAAVGPAAAELTEAGVEVVLTGQHDILSDPRRVRAVIQGIWNFKARRALAEMLAPCDPDDTIVHVHSWTKALSSCVFRHAIRAGFPVVCTLHDYFMVCPNGGLFNYPENTICSRMPMSFGCLFTNCDARSYAQKMWRIVRQLVQRYAGLVPHGLANCICISALSRSVLHPFLPETARIHFVPNPVWEPGQNHVRVAANTDFVFVGRLSREKGVLLFAEAAQRLGIRPVFVGDGDQARAIREICPNACITGWVTRDELEKYLGRARALVFPSLWYETQGLVVAEAAAMGIPAIVSDTCAARDMVEDQKNGLWFSGGDPDDLCVKIELLQDAERAGRMGDLAHEHYQKEPGTLDRHVGALLRCYDAMIESARQGHGPCDRRERSV
jgi:glycosyltransferase involved in cell wall biosynthesis